MHLMNAEMVKVTYLRGVVIGMGCCIREMLQLEVHSVNNWHIYLTLKEIHVLGLAT